MFEIRFFGKQIQNINTRTKPLAPLLKGLTETKILILSDFHMASNDELRMLSELKYGSDYEICFVLGDIERQDLLEIKRMIKNIHGVTGNHDAKELLRVVGINDLNGNLLEYNGLKIVGLAGGFKYKDNDYVSMVSQSESSYIAIRLPDADILISHDSAHNQVTDEYAHQGLIGISEYIDRCNPAIHLYGHHHENRFDIIGETNSFCTYKCNILNTGTMKIRNIF